MSFLSGKAKIAQWDPGKTVDEVVTQVPQSADKAGGQLAKGDIAGFTKTTTDPGKAFANTQGAHNTNMGNVSNAYHTSVTDPLNDLAKQAKDFLNGVPGMGGGGAGSIPSLGSIPQVTGPGAAPVLKAPTQSFGVAPIAGQQIAFNTATPYAANAAAAQSGLMQQLAAQSRGEGPSLAGQQLKTAQEANIAAVMAQMASARGGANPLLQRQALTTSADIQAQTARDAATARMQEQLAAQGLLGQVSGQATTQGLQARGQDLQLATNQAGLNQDAAMAGFNAQTDANKTLFLAQQQTQLAQADLTAKYAAMGMTAQQAQQAAALELEKLKVAAAAGDGAAKATLLGGLMSGGGAILGGLYGGPAGAAAGGAVGGAVANGVQQQQAPANPYEVDVGGYTPEARDAAESAPTFVGPPTAASQYGTGEYGDYRPTYSGGALVDPHSDETLKTNITDGSANLEKMLAALSASEYEYKDKKHGEGKHIGPMAQELQKSEAGSRLVYRADDGLKVDAARAAMAALSANAMILERVKQLEAKKRKH